MRILVTGAKGMLGTDLVRRFAVQGLRRDFGVSAQSNAQSNRSRFKVIGIDIDDLDITDEEKTVKKIKKISPDIVINTAAFTDVDACETEREVAFKVNRDGVRNVVLGCREVGAKLIHISTDYVFDGKKGEPYRENDDPGPINIYGLSKLEGEKEILKLETRNSKLETLIVRTSWLFGKNGRNFVDTILRVANSKDELRVVDDQVGSPTYTVDLAGAIERLVDAGASGIVHCGNSGECSWYDFAKEIMRIKRIKGVNVVPIKSGELKRPATRPSYSVLSNDRYFQLTGHRMRKWEEALRDYLNPPLTPL